MEPSIAMEVLETQKEVANKHNPERKQDWTETSWLVEKQEEGLQGFIGRIAA